MYLEMTLPNAEEFQMVSAKTKGMKQYCCCDGKNEL
jgi:hypothetical protein